MLQGDEVDECVVHICNLDAGVTERDVKEAFGVKDATLGHSGQARLRFPDAQGAAAALKMESVTVKESAALRGLNKYLAECQQRPDPVALAREVDEYMIAFDEREVSKKEKLAAAPVVDADGFTLVTRARRGNTKQGKLGVKATTARKRAPVAGNADPNFYQYLALQKQMEQLNELREKHQSDRARLATLKGEREARKFRP